MIRTLLCMLAVAVWTGLLFPLACLLMLVRLPAGWLARRLWAPVLLWASGTRVEVEGAEHVDPRRPMVYVSNHQSTLDIPVLFAVLPVDLRFVAKEQLRWVPLIGWYLQLGGHVLVDRSKRVRAIASLERAAARVARQRISLFAFPEGTRSPDGRILPFKRGIFGLVLKARMPVVPVVLEGSASVMPRGSWRFTPGLVRVRILPPVDSSAFGSEDRQGLADAVRKAIIEASLALGGRGPVPDVLLPEDRVAAGGETLRPSTPS
jgi:1-acyl-sn-glycerol-3-phosphate acyltransferase